MSADLDLFADPPPPEPPKTCGNYGACEKRQNQSGHYCSLSYATVDPKREACDNGWWYPRLDKPGAKK
jgi:hypothetical protein